MIGFGDTVAAVSTPRGKGGVAVIRVSGAEAIAVCDRVFRAASGKTLGETESRRAIFGYIFDGDECVDDGIVTLFRAPRSFTGEDTVEISCHGGVLVTEAVLGAILGAGARPAEAGEFTRRAFVNGKMGLSNAEALASLLEANNRNQMRLSRAGLEGKLSERCREVYGRLCDILGSLYAKIDYPDEDLSGLSAESLRDMLAAERAELLKLAATYKSGHAVAEGILTVICGRPNAGKSSLYNQIVGRDAAIVTDVAGTTRDILEETVPFGGVTLRLCDTAGLRGGDVDAVERIGIERAEARLVDAELILALFDGSAEPTEEDHALIARLSPMKEQVIPVVSKSDLGTGRITVLLEEAFGSFVSVTVRGKEGLAALENEVRARFLDGNIDLRNDPVVASARQYASVTRALEALDAALSSLDGGFAEELCAADIERAMQAVGELDSRAVSDDIVSNIFSRFCVGK